MAAEIKPLRASHLPQHITYERPILLSKVEGGSEDVHGAVLLHDANQIISICDDKSIRIWQKRDSGQYWPSVCHYLPSKPGCLHFTLESRHLFVGLDNGTIMEFVVAVDYNSVLHKRDYLGHQSNVTSVVYASTSEWILSISRDKYFVYHSTETGQRIGGHQCTAWCTAMEYDALSNHVFVGDYSGHIAMLKLGDSGCQLITTLKGHNGSLQSLAWDPERKLLFSGSFDKSIVVWDMGGGKGTAYELQGHMGKVSTLRYLSAYDRLMSGGEDSIIITWDMGTKREETPEWAESDVCQYCGRPFFWNLWAMVDQKQIGLRQHHCRKCGKAVCDSCSNKRSSLPALGFEFQVRVCSSCYESITDTDRVSLAKFQEVKHSIVSLDVDQEGKLMLTVGQDRVLKIWDVSALLPS